MIGILSGGIAVMAWMSYLTRSGLSASAPLLGVVGCFFLTYALPYAAIRIVEWEGDGRLDQLRLTGLPPRQLLLTVAGMAMVPWAVSGLIYLTAAAWLGGMPPYWGRIVLLTIGASAAVSVLAMSLPATRRVTDLRIVMIGAGLYTGAFSVMAMNSDRPIEELFAAYLFAHPWRVAVVLLAQVIVVAACVPRVLSGIARPPAARTTASLPLRPSAMWFPVPAALRRGMSIGLIAALGLTIFILVIVTGILVAGRQPTADAAIVAAFLPWIVGAVVVATTGRSDLETGRLDVLRLARSSAPAMAVKMTADLWVPFLAGCAVIIAVFSVVASQSLNLAYLVYALLITGLVAPMALLEGWHRALMLTYVVPTLFAGFLLMPSNSRLTFGALLPFLALIWIPWGVTASALRRGVGVPLDRRLAMLAAVAVVVGLDWEMTRMGLAPRPASAAAMLLLAAWLHDGSRSWRSVWPLPLMVLVIGIALRLHLDITAEVTLGATLPAVAILAGLLIHQALAGRPQPWSTAVRTALVLLLMTLDTAVMRVMILPRMRGPGSVGAADYAAAYRTSVIVGIVLMLATALVVRAFARRPATLRA